MSDDLVVVGAGPAGGAIAALAAAAGAQVTLVERKRFPREKLCGEFVSAPGCGVLARLSVLDGLVAAGAVPIRSFRLVARNGRMLEATLPAEAMGVSRALLDREVADRARLAGARVLHGQEALEVVRDARGVITGVVVREVGRSDTRTLPARVVVAADGRRSRLAGRAERRTGDPRRTRSGSRFALQVHLSGDTGPVGDRVELHLLRHGYAGLAAIEGSRMNLCLLLQARDLRAAGRSPARVLDDLVRGHPAVRATLAGARPEGRFRSIGPLRFGPREPAADGILFVGDAAGTVDPFAGMGIAHALLAAELALPYVLEAIERGGLDEEGSRSWAEAWRQRFVSPTRRLRRLGRLLERPALAGTALRVLDRRHGAWAARLVASTQAP